MTVKEYYDLHNQDIDMIGVDEDISLYEDLEWNSKGKKNMKNYYITERRK